MIKKSHFAFLSLLWILVSCAVEPAEIDYGKDACKFCKMTIVDQQHAEQFVTGKGKQYKYDAVECMLNDLSETGLDSNGLYLVPDYTAPGLLTDATDATFLISKEIKGPMGAFFSAFSSSLAAEEAREGHGGDLYTWDEILKKFEVNK